MVTIFDWHSKTYTIFNWHSKIYFEDIFSLTLLRGALWQDGFCFIDPTQRLRAP